MKLRLTPATLIILLIISFLMASAQASTKAPVTISLSPLDKDHIKLEYHLPQNCKTLALYSTYGERTHDLRKGWSPLDACGHLNEKDVLEVGESCDTVRFAVSIKAIMIDRVNPVAYPFDEQGVLIHTATFITDNTCGDVDWHFSAPKGAIIIKGLNRGSSTTLPQKTNSFITYTGVFLSAKPRPKHPSLIATNTTPTWLKQGISDGSAKITQYYQKTYPKLSFVSPTLFISNTIEPNSSGMQADVSSRSMIRFGYFNAGNKPNEENIKNTLNITAHEFSHLLQPSFKAAPLPFIQEGGAEFIRWITSYKLGWRSKTELANEFSSALANCLDIADTRNFKTVEKENLQLGYGIYTCGLAVHIMGLASRQTTVSAEETMREFYQNWRINDKQDFAQAIECGDLTECKSIWLADMLNGNKSFAQKIDEQLNHLTLIKNRSAGNNPTTISSKAFESLMNEDCGGVGYWAKGDNFYTDRIPTQCKAFTNGLSITKVEGISYFAEPLKALAAQNQGCTTKHSVTLSTLDNKSINIACTREYIPANNYYEIDIDKLLTLLDKQQIK